MKGLVAGWNRIPPLLRDYLTSLPIPLVFLWVLWVRSRQGAVPLAIWVPMILVMTFIGVATRRYVHRWAYARFRRKQ